MCVAFVSFVVRTQNKTKQNTIVASMPKHKLIEKHQHTLAREKKKEKKTRVSGKSIRRRSQRLGVILKRMKSEKKQQQQMLKNAANSRA